MWRPAVVCGSLVCGDVFSRAVVCGAVIFGDIMCVGSRVGPWCVGVCFFWGYGVVESGLRGLGRVGLCSVGLWCVGMWSPGLPCVGLGCVGCGALGHVVWGSVSGAVVCGAVHGGGAGAMGVLGAVMGCGALWVQTNPCTRDRGP